MPYPVSYNEDTSILTNTWVLGEVRYTDDTATLVLEFTEGQELTIEIDGELDSEILLDGELLICEEA